MGAEAKVADDAFFLHFAEFRHWTAWIANDVKVFGGTRRAKRVEIDVVGLQADQLLFDAFTGFTGGTWVAFGHQVVALPRHMKDFVQHFAVAVLTFAITQAVSI